MFHTKCRFFHSVQRNFNNRFACSNDWILIIMHRIALLSRFQLDFSKHFTSPFLRDETFQIHTRLIGSIIKKKRTYSARDKQKRSDKLASRKNGGRLESAGNKAQTMSTLELATLGHPLIAIHQWHVLIIRKCSRQRFPQCEPALSITSHEHSTRCTRRGRRDGCVFLGLFLWPYSNVLFHWTRVAKLKRRV